MPGLPVAGQGPGVDPYKYGQFQNFLPDIKAEGPNDMATGLRPDMFNYKKPGGGAVDTAGGGGGGSGGNVEGEIQGLRDQLAQLTAGGGGRGGMLPVGFNDMGLAQQQRYGIGQDFMGGRGGYPWGQNGPDVSS
jgi:hypothetical protein